MTDDLRSPRGNRIITRYGLTGSADVREQFPPGAEGDEAHWRDFARAMMAAGWRPPPEALPPPPAPAPRRLPRTLRARIAEDIAADPEWWGRLIDHIREARADA
ncbi:MAG: hypothetical protein WD066_17710 [Planctomycetaceae bacterium]